jgi:hypothetical protein
LHIQQNRHGSQRAEQPAYPQRIADGLPQPVLCGYFKVAHAARLKPADLRGTYNIAAAGQGGSAVLIGDDTLLRPILALDVLKHHTGLAQPLCVNVVQGDLRVMERGGKQKVTQHTLGKYRTARTDHCDFCHIATPL